MLKKQYYNKQTGRIFWEFTENKPQVEYWEEHWKKIEDPVEYLKKFRPNVLIKKINNFVRKGVIPSKSKILEAGCGFGQNVYHLNQEGFEAEGIDFAKDIIKTMSTHVSIFHGNLNDIPRKDSIYDCCVSLGVIEHPCEGPEQMLNEMHRVTKNNGVVFCSIPHINFIRKVKILIKAYPAKEMSEETFYQYAFSRKCILKTFNSCGYKLIASYNYGALKGIKDEILFLNKVIGWIYRLPPPFNIITKILNYGLAFFSGHMKMYILKVIK